HGRPGRQKQNVDFVAIPFNVLPQARVYISCDIWLCAPRLAELNSDARVKSSPCCKPRCCWHTAGRSPQTALEKRLPTVYGHRDHVVAGGLKITTACEKFRLRNCRGQYPSAHCVEIQRYGSSPSGLSA